MGSRPAASISGSRHVAEQQLGLGVAQYGCDRCPAGPPLAARRPPTGSAPASAGRVKRANNEFIARPLTIFTAEPSHEKASRISLASRMSAATTAAASARRPYRQPCRCWLPGPARARCRPLSRAREQPPAFFERRLRAGFSAGASSSFAVSSGGASTGAGSTTTASASGAAFFRLPRLGGVGSAPQPVAFRRSAAPRRSASRPSASCRARPHPHWLRRQERLRVHRGHADGGAGHPRRGS